MKPVGEEAEKFVTKQKGEVYQRAVIVWQYLFSLFRCQRAAKDCSGILEAMHVRISFNLRMVIVHKPIHRGVRVEQETQQQQAAEQQASRLWGNPVRHGHS